MAFEKLCRREALAPGAMIERAAADGTRVLLVRLTDGALRAYQAACPHAAVALAEGTFEAGLVTCREHWWQFDAATGAGTNPTGCHLAAYPIEESGDDILVDVTGIVPFKAGRGVS